MERAMIFFGIMFGIFVASTLHAIMPRAIKGE